MSIALAFAVFVMFATVNTAITGEELIPEASAGTTMSENITETIEEYIPLVIALTFIGIALGGLGIHMNRQN